MSEIMELGTGFGIEQLSGQLRPGDVLLLAGLHKISHPHREPGSIPELTEILQEYAHPYKHHNALFVVRQKSIAAVAGAATVYLKTRGNEHPAHIDEIFVGPRYRGLGLGKALLQQCIQFAETNRAPYLQLDRIPMDETSHHLFRQAGFEPSGDGLPRLTFDVQD